MEEQKMAQNSKRSILLHTNRFQEKILMPFYISCIIAIFSLLLLALSNNPLFGPVHYRSLLQGQLSFRQILEVFSGFLIAVIFFLLIYWAYYISNKILGAYDRILRELDDIIVSKKNTRPIKARDGDEFFTEMLRRINILIQERASKIS